MTKQQIVSDAYNRYEKDLERYSYYKVHNAALAQDLVQETFTKTWLYLSKGGRVSAMRSFLYHLLNCLIIDEYRKRKTTSLDRLLEKGFEPALSSREDLDTKCDIEEGTEFMGLMSSLPKKYSDVLTLRYSQELTLDEIAKKTKRSKNTVTVQIHRGLSKLRSMAPASV